MEILLHTHIRRTSLPRLAKCLVPYPTTAKLMPQGVVAGTKDVQAAQPLLVRGLQRACQYAG